MLRNRSKKSDRTRASILSAALRVIARKGYSSATVDEIVKEAGVSKGLAYYHFKNKAALASAVLKEGVDTLIVEFERIANEAENASDALRGMFGIFVDTVVDNREFGRFFFSELWREGRVWSQEMRASEERIIDIISGLYRRGQADGSIDPHVDPAFAAVSSVGLVLSASMYYFGDQDSAPSISKEEFSERVFSFVRHATSA